MGSWGMREENHKQPWNLGRKRQVRKGELGCEVSGGSKDILLWFAQKGVERGGTGGNGPRGGEKMLGGGGENITDYVIWQTKNPSGGKKSGGAKRFFIKKKNFAENES